ncbi:MAG: glycoside hydrolase family 16 protein, partial [Bacteroidota bacterium]
MEIVTDRLTILMAVICVGVFSACTPATTSVESPESLPTPTYGEWTLEAESFYEAETGTTLSEDGSAIELAEGANTSASFELEVPVAGRYQVEVLASLTAGEKAEFWIEDYIDNQDGRTYNVTGTMVLATGASPMVDGSPLNFGMHNIKLHKSGGGATVDGIRFTLIREHELTPDTLVQNMEGESWKLVWADEFDSDGLPDQSKWTYDVGNWGWGNNELQYYTVSEPRNARIEGGNLIIEAHKNDGGNPWTSARLTTRGKVTFVHGKIEFRAKVPVERGNWAAGWTLGDAYRDELSWPYCGEIDILETVGFELDDATGDGEAHASVHCGAYYFKLGNQPTAIT